MDRIVNTNEMNTYYGKQAVELIKTTKDEVVERPTTKEQYKEFIGTVNDLINTANKSKGIEKMRSLFPYEKPIHNMAMAINSNELLNVARKLKEYSNYSENDYVEDYYINKYF